MSDGNDEADGGPAAAKGGTNDASSLRDDVFDEAAGNAMRELHYGRLEWLAYHIRQSDYRIHPIVAKKLLEMIENKFVAGDERPHCLFELKAVRLSGLPPAFRDPQLEAIRNFTMAIEVARKCQFKRAQVLRACHEVGERHGLKAAYVRNVIAPFQKEALQVFDEEEMQAAYERGEIDFLGPPISE